MSEEGSVHVSGRIDTSDSCKLYTSQLVKGSTIWLCYCLLCISIYMAESVQLISTINRGKEDLRLCCDSGIE